MIFYSFWSKVWERKKTSFKGRMTFALVFGIALPTLLYVSAWLEGANLKDFWHVFWFIPLVLTWVLLSYEALAWHRRVTGKRLEKKYSELADVGHTLVTIALGTLCFVSLMTLLWIFMQIWGDG